MDLDAFATENVVNRFIVAVRDTARSSLRWLGDLPCDSRERLHSKEYELAAAPMAPTIMMAKMAAMINEPRMKPSIEANMNLKNWPMGGVVVVGRK